MELRTGGNFDFLPHVYTDTNLDRRAILFRVSDHLPLSVEFGIWAPDKFADVLAETNSSLACQAGNLHTLSVKGLQRRKRCR